MTAIRPTQYDEAGQLEGGLMGGSVSGEEARGVLGFLRRLLHAPDLTAGMGCAIAGGATLVAIALVVVLVYLAMNTSGSEPAASDAPPAQPTQQAAVPQEADPSAVENPTPVGQAVDAIAAPAIGEVLGEPVLTRASEAEALIVNLVYQAPNAAAEGDGERLRDELISRGAAVDPASADVDYHGDAEEFVVRYDTGDSAFQTIRVTVTPGSTDVYVNADKSE
jgi:hypothetical protein